MISSFPMKRRKSCITNLLKICPLWLTIGHISPAEIAENRVFENITQAWLGGDHYKWRLMRSNGVDERYITGDASDREKFQAFAELMPKAIGNPMYHWCHLELRRYFGCEQILSGETAEGNLELLQ